MTNPDNVGGLPDLPAPDFMLRWDSMRAAYYVSRPNIGNTDVYTADQMRAYGELCRAAPAGGECDKFRPGAPCQSPGRCRENGCRENGCSAVERELFAPSGGDAVDTMLALIPRPAMAHHKMDEAEEREIKRVNRFRDRVIENIKAHCASRPVSAPAGGDDLYRQACDSVEEWKARALEAEADIARIHAQINAENGPTFMGEPVVSAPAGSGEVEQMAKRLDDERAIEEETGGLEDTIDAMRTAAALLRKLSPAGSGEVEECLMSSEHEWTILDCPHCGRCVKYCKKAISSKEAYRDLTAEVTSLRAERDALLRKLQQGAE